MSQYRSLDRSTNAVIFFASLLVAASIFGSVVTVFGHAAPRIWVPAPIEEVVVQG